MFTNRLYVVLILILSSFALADALPPPAVVAQYPTLDAHHPNKIPGGGSYTMTNGKVVIKVPPSTKPFGGVSSSGGNIVGGYPANATVNNGYGNTGSINTQAASTYGKMGPIRTAANGAASKALTAAALYGMLTQGYDIGSNLWPILDNMVYDTPMPPSSRPPPTGAPASPSSQNSANWKEPNGAYNPNAKVIIVVATGSFPETGGAPFASYYLQSGGLSGSGSSSPYKITVASGVEITINSPGGDWYASTFPATKANIDKYADVSIDKVRPGDFQRPYTQEDFFKDLIWNLEHQPQDIATAIMNALHDGGYLGAPDSTVFDPASYTSPPYTAADTGVAQQDKFTLNQDGSMTHQVVQRPDLQGNNQLAPEKQPSTESTNPTEPEKPVEPDDEVIPPVVDVEIPTQELPITFTPDNTFQADGVCPAPTVLNVMGTSFDISYEPYCYFAQKIRPALILISAFSCLIFCLSVVFKG